MAPRHELNDRFKSYVASARRARLAATTLLVVCAVAGTAAGFNSLVPPEQIQRAHTAAGGSMPGFDALADMFYRAVCPIFGDCPREDINAVQPSPPAPQPTPQAVTTRTPTLQPAPSAVVPPAQPAIVQQPVIERVRETVRIVTEPGTKAGYVDARLSALEQSLLAQIARVSNNATRQSENIYQTLGDVSRIDNLDDVTITNVRITGGSITGASITGTISNAIDSLIGAILDLTATNLTATHATTTNLAVTGTARIGSATGVLQTTSGVVSAIPFGSDGQVLKIVSGAPTWSTDLASGGGGASAWATTTNDLAIVQADPNDVVIIGATATTTTGNILEVRGSSLFRGVVTAYQTVMASSFTATSSVASQLPFASTTAISATIATTTALIISNSSGGLLKTNSVGAVSVAIAGTDYLASTAGDWTGTLDGQEGAFYLSNAFATTSAKHWQTTRNFFSTTSAEFWEVQQTARAADDLTNNAIEDLNDVGAITETFGDVFAWNGSAWTDFATSSLAIALSDTTGTLGATRGGTGLSSVAAAGILLGNYAGTGWQQLATSTLGLLTTHVQEGSNLYYLDSRVQSFVHASSTIPKTYTNNTFTGSNTFSALTLGSLNGPLHANNGLLSATTSIGVLYGGTGLTTAPTYGQLLVGNASGGYTLTATSSLGITDGSRTVGSGTLGFLPYYAGSGSTLTATSTLFLAANGALGIGTTSPTEALHVEASSARARLWSTGAGSNAGYRLRGLSSGGVSRSGGYYFVPGDTTAATYLGLSADEVSYALVATAAGNVGVGTTTPLARLNISDSSNPSGSLLVSGAKGVRLGTSAVGGHIEGVDYTGFGSYQPLAVGGSDVRFTNSGTEHMRLTGGNLGIGTTSPWRTLSVTGTVGLDGLTGATGAGSLCLDSKKQVVYNSASDSCLSSTRETKDAITPLALDDLGIVSALQPVSFKYKEGDGRTRFGFIAEDAAAIDPHLTTYNASGTVSGIDDRSLLAILVGAIRELASRISETSHLVIQMLTTQCVQTHELCIDDICVTRDQFVHVFGPSQSAAAGSRQFPEAPIAPEPIATEPASSASTTANEPNEAVPRSRGSAPFGERG